MSTYKKLILLVLNLLLLTLVSEGNNKKVKHKKPPVRMLAMEKETNSQDTMETLNNTNTSTRYTAEKPVVTIQIQNFTMELNSDKEPTTQCVIGTGNETENGTIICVNEVQNTTIEGQYLIHDTMKDVADVLKTIMKKSAAAADAVTPLPTQSHIPMEHLATGQVEEPPTVSVDNLNDNTSGKEESRDLVLHHSNEITSDLQSQRGLFNFVCPEPYGFYPVLEDCNMFIECEAWIPKLRNCPFKLNYNRDLQECDIITDDECSFVCPASGNFPLPGDCSSYIQCIMGTAKLIICPPGKHWNRALQRCDDKSTAGCPFKCTQQNGTLPCQDDCTFYILCQHGVPRLKKCPPGLVYGYGLPSCQPHQPGLCPLDFQCQARGNRFPNLGDCHTYYECTKKGKASLAGTVVLKACPAHLHYDYMKEQCDVNKTVCVDQCPHPDGIFSISGLCHRYKICTAGVATLYLCADGLHFDPVHQNCDFPERAGCTSELKCPEANSVIPVPGKCSQYAICTHGVPEVHTCVADLHWNRLLQTCDSPENANCELKFGSSQCPEAYGLFPIPGRCEYYLSCFDGSPLLQRCSEGLLFHPHTYKCTPADAVPCTVHCPASDGFYPVEGDCTAYIRCLRYVPTFTLCSEGQRFNPTISQCDLAKNVMCEPECPQPYGRFPISGLQAEAFVECINSTSTLRYCSLGLKLDPETEICSW